MRLQFPRLGRYILEEDWMVDMTMERKCKDIIEYSSWWKNRYIDRFVNMGAYQFSETSIIIPKGVVFHLWSLKASTTGYKSTIVIRFYKKYNGSNNQFWDNNLKLTFDSIDIPARLLDEAELMSLVRERKV